MPVPSPRNSIRIARGNYADLAANATEIGEGELCFAIDQDKFYSKSGGSLVAVGGGTELYSIQQLGDVDVSGATNGQVLSWNGTTWVPSSSAGAPVDSVNGQTGTVVLDASDVGAAPSTIDLQAVTDNGNTTTNGASFADGRVEILTPAQGGYLNVHGDGQNTDRSIQLKDGQYKVRQDTGANVVFLTRNGATL